MQLYLCVKTPNTLHACMDINGPGNVDGTFGISSDSMTSRSGESVSNRHARSLECCGPSARQPWIHHALRLNGEKGTTVLEVPYGDARFGGTICCDQLNITGNSGGSSNVYLLQDWSDYLLTLRVDDEQEDEETDQNGFDQKLMEVRHARFRRLNNGVTVHVDIDVLLKTRADEISVSLPVPTTTPYVCVSTGMFDWTAPPQEPAVTNPPRGVTLGRLEVRENADHLVFYSPAFEPGLWRLRGQIEYEV